MKEDDGVTGFDDLSEPFGLSGSVFGELTRAAELTVEASGVRRAHPSRRKFAEGSSAEG